MNFSYNNLVQKVDVYLRRKRDTSRLWRILLPEQLFSPALWLWEPRGVATGSAWGVCWALAPVPMQTIFAVLSAMWTRGNIPMSVVSCWISIPGYQIIVWPLQWYVGALLLGSLSMSSGVDMQLMREAAAAAPDGIAAVLSVLGRVNLWLLCLELLLGCLVTCTALGGLVYGSIRLLWPGQRPERRPD